MAVAEAFDASALEWSTIPVPLPAPGRTCAFDVGELRLLLCNADGAPFVVRDVCPHMAVPLSGGTLRGSVLECPLHGGRLDVRDGAPVGRPIRKRAQCFPVRWLDGGLEVAVASSSN